MPKRTKTKTESEEKRERTEKIAQTKEQQKHTYKWLNDKKTQNESK